jgi:hypothetical protein
MAALRYRTVEIAADELEQALNDFAQQGWELVSITPSGWRELEDFQLEVIRYRAVFKS